MSAWACNQQSRPTFLWIKLIGFVLSRQVISKFINMASRTTFSLSLTFHQSASRVLLAVSMSDDVTDQMLWRLSLVR